jgi:dGTPase
MNTSGSATSASDGAKCTRVADALSHRESALLAPYAQHSAASAGRRHAEPPHPYRGPYQRDRDRILHSSAFRRLSYKTQVFTGEMGDYHRTRLTHTLEVASIARTIARTLRLNEDLVEALALAHDIGHPPFGHSGEDVLNECLRDYGGFTHNAQALRIVEVLETRYSEFPGLNLTYEVLEGQRARVAKELGAETSGVEEQTSSGVEEQRSSGGAARRTPLLHSSTSPLLHSSTAALPCSPLLEAQVVDAADSIAYDAHDADDALEIGLLKLNELLEVPMWRDARDRVARRYAGLSDRHLRRAIVHEVIDWQVSDVLDVVHRALAQRPIRTVDDVRRTAVVVHPSTELAEKKTGLERFLFERVYRHPDVLAKRERAQQALRETFATLVQSPDKLPSKFRRLADRDGVPRAVGDYLAGMTDRFAFEEHRRLIG